MRQVFYIDVDEEIIAVIGRLRRSASHDDTLVVPKRALILQSIVNLRLLAREAQKLGKDILVVTQDEQGRLLAEKAGLSTSVAMSESASSENSALTGTFTEASLEVSETISPLSVSPDPSSREMFGNSETKHQDGFLPHSESVGSSSFFNVPGPSLQKTSFHGNVSEETQSHLKVYPAVSTPAPVQPKKLIVRDRSPKNLTALNSQMASSPLDQPSPQSWRQSAPPAIAAPQSMSIPQQMRHQESFQQPTSAPRPPQPMETDTSSPKLPSYFRHSAHEQGVGTSHYTSSPVAKNTKPKEAPSPTVSTSKKLKSMFWFFALVSVLSLAGLGAYLFLPKAEVILKLKTFTQKTDTDFFAQANSAASFQEKTLPIRWVEKEGQVEMSFDSTGKSSLSDRKARGTLIIRNEYSADPQPLVASTRLLSQDGKLFRLVSGVTVPGMVSKDDQNEPGSVEAAVIADQSGAEYNIGPSSFTIPGFQGSPKYAKFSAQSIKIMSGGGVDGSDAKAVSDDDIAKAKKMAESSVNNEARRLVESDLVAGEKLLDDAFETSVISSNASPQPGTMADTFKYRVAFKVQAMVFPENVLKDTLNEILAKQPKNQSDALSVKQLDIEYGEPTPDFSSRTLKIKVHAVAKLQPNFDVDQFKEEALGKDEQGIAALFERYSQQIETVNVNFWPEFLIHRIPTNAERVTVSLDTSSGTQK